MIVEWTSERMSKRISERVNERMSEMAKKNTSQCQAVYEIQEWPTEKNQPSTYIYRWNFDLSVNIRHRNRPSEAKIMHFNDITRPSKRDYSSEICCRNGRNSWCSFRKSVRWRHAVCWHTAWCLRRKRKLLKQWQNVGLCGRMLEEIGETRAKNKNETRKSKKTKNYIKIE